MRLFTAINFDEKVKSALLDMQSGLRKNSLKGNFTMPENLHLTVIFIGETAPDRVSGIKATVDKVSRPLDITIEGGGVFGSENRAIWWAGVTDIGGALAGVYANLFKELSSLNIWLEKLAYTPHMTLARQAVPVPGFDAKRFLESFPPIKYRAERIDLMKSERLNGKLTYTVL